MIPRRRSPVQIEPYYQLVGMITVSWAFIETSLDLSNFQILHRGGGKEIQTDMPVSLKPKIAFFRKAHDRLPRLASLKAEGLALVAQIVAQKESRHSFVHSILPTDPNGVGVRTRQQITFDGDLLGIKYSDFTISQAIDISDDARALCLRTHKHMLAVCDALAGYEIDDINS